jgi:hypothetical protein
MISVLGASNAPLAGNNLARRFDVDRSRGDPSIATTMTDTALRLIRVRMERFGKL